MIVIGIVDDNFDQRESFREAIDIYLRKSNRTEVEIVDTEPLANIEDYFNWIIENDIAALIIDEKLADIPLKSTGLSCGYEGHEMAADLRKRLSTIPIHVVTSAKTNDELNQNRELFENVLSRTEFLDRKEQFAEIFIRSAQRFYHENRKLFERMAVIAKKIVQDEVTTEEIEELNGIQEYIQVPLLNTELLYRKDLLDYFRDDIEELKKIRKEAKDYLDS